MCDMHKINFLNFYERKENFRLFETTRNIGKQISLMNRGDRKKYYSTRNKVYKRSKRKRKSLCQCFRTPHLHAVLSGTPVIISVAEIEYLKDKKNIPGELYKSKEIFDVYPSLNQTHGEQCSLPIGCLQEISRNDVQRNSPFNETPDELLKTDRKNEEESNLLLSEIHDDEWRKSNILKEEILKEQMDIKISKLEMELMDLRASIASQEQQAQNRFEAVKKELSKISESLSPIQKNIWKKCNKSRNVEVEKNCMSHDKKPVIIPRNEESQNEVLFSQDSDSESGSQLTESTYRKMKRKLTYIRTSFSRLNPEKMESLKKELSELRSEIIDTGGYKNTSCQTTMEEARNCNKTKKKKPSNKLQKNLKASQTSQNEFNSWKYEEEAPTIVRNSRQNNSNNLLEQHAKPTKKIGKQADEVKILLKDSTWRECMYTPPSVYEPSAQSLPPQMQFGGQTVSRKPSPDKRKEIKVTKDEDAIVKEASSEVHKRSTDEKPKKKKKKKRGGRKKGAGDENPDRPMIVVRLELSGDESRCQACCQPLPKYSGRRLQSE